jgi:hypothetical protein
MCVVIVVIFASVMYEVCMYLYVRKSRVLLAVQPDSLQRWQYSILLSNSYFPTTSTTGNLLLE